MLLEPITQESTLALPDGFDSTDMSHRKDIMAFEVIDIGPWDKYPVEWGSDEAYHDIKIGDRVMVEGLNFAVVDYNNKKYAVSRARNVIYKLVEEE